MGSNGLEVGVTFRKAYFLGIAATLMLSAAITTVVFAQNGPNQVYRLASGKQIKLLGIDAKPGSNGAARSLILRYQTERNIADKKEIAAEADDVWDMFKVELEKNSIGAAVISVYAQPLGGGKFNQQYDFVLVKDGTGKWQCFNDDVVGVGTQAKIAYRQGLVLMNQGNTAGALAQFDKCISLDPQYGPAYIDRGAAHLALNQADKAVADANMALSLLPDNSGVYCNRGIALWKLNQRQKALEDFSKVISLNPDNHLGYMNRGAALVELGQYEQGIADLNKAISINPKIARPYHNRSVAYQKLAERDRQQAAELGHKGVQTASAGGGTH